MSTPIVLKTGCGITTNTGTDALHAQHFPMANYRPSGATTALRVSSDSKFYVLIALVFAGSSVATVYFCGSMSGGMDMPGGWTMSMMWMRMPDQTWTSSTAMFLLMWLARMVAMMLPSALP